jgi:hypothetical protein
MCKGRLSWILEYPDDSLGEYAWTWTVAELSPGRTGWATGHAPGPGLVPCERSACMMHIKILVSNVCFAHEVRFLRSYRNVYKKKRCQTEYLTEFI